MKILNNWGVVFLNTDPYLAPELRLTALRGIRDGELHFITTSAVVGKTKTNEVVTASGSVYILGSVDPVYEEMYPGAKERVFDSLKVVDVNEIFDPV